MLAKKIFNMRRLRWILIILPLIFAFFILMMPKYQTTKNDLQVITVSSRPLATTLFFSGTLQPLKTIVVTSPVDGVIEDMPFHYGEIIKANRLLFEIVSEKFQSDYKTALTQYIKAKTDYTSSQTQLKEATFLYKNQLISRDNFNDKKVSFYNSQFSLIQAKETLSHILKRLDLQGVNPYDLKISDIDKITEALRLQDGAKHLQIKMPETGVVLLPTKEDASDGSLKKIIKGTQVKQGDVLAVISDLSSLVVHITVSEFNVNQLHVGQTVTVTGSAFPEFTLSGKIIGIEKQGQPNQSGLPAFPVDIAITNLTEAQKAVIHIGMSAEVAIHLQENSAITLPIAAVIQEAKGTFVNLQDPKTHQVKKVAVKTGRTTLDSVIIEANLKDGDRIVLPS